MGQIRQIIKRDGRHVPFDQTKITNAIYAAATVLGGQDRSTAEQLSADIVAYLTDEQQIAEPTVEQVQDAVEKILIEKGHARTAKEYIPYRAERTRIRNMNTKLIFI